MSASGGKDDMAAPGIGVSTRLSGQAGRARSRWLYFQSVMAAAQASATEMRRAHAPRLACANRPEGMPEA